jgi:hypothetical protein
MDEWRDKELRAHGLPEHLYEHFLTMAKLHSANRYDRLTSGLEAILPSPSRGSDLRLGDEAPLPIELQAKQRAIVNAPMMR